MTLDQQNLYGYLLDHAEEYQRIWPNSRGVPMFVALRLNPSNARNKVDFWDRILASKVPAGIWADDQAMLENLIDDYDDQQLHELSLRPPSREAYLKGTLQIILGDAVCGLLDSEKLVSVGGLRGKRSKVADKASELAALLEGDGSLRQLTVEDLGRIAQRSAGRSATFRRSVQPDPILELTFVDVLGALSVSLVDNNGDPVPTSRDGVFVDGRGRGKDSAVSELCDWLVQGLQRVKYPRPWPIITHLVNILLDKERTPEALSGAYRKRKLRGGVRQHYYY